MLINSSNNNKEIYKIWSKLMRIVLQKINNLCKRSFSLISTIIYKINKLNINKKKFFHSTKHIKFSQKYTKINHKLTQIYN